MNFNTENSVQYFIRTFFQLS